MLLRIFAIVLWHISLFRIRARVVLGKLVGMLGKLCPDIERKLRYGATWQGQWFGAVQVTLQGPGIKWGRWAQVAGGRAGGWGQAR
jgi:hypothetical protein